MASKSEASDIESLIETIPLHRIRNFAIVAHVDHGKSTLADRLLQMTGLIESGANAQYLDKLVVERERGITVKAQTVTLRCWLPSEGGSEEEYLFNLIDTPGHVDFAYEVSRSLAACDGVLLLVDASQGIEAQTMQQFNAAMEADLHIIPVLNKVDLPGADPDKVAAQVSNAFGFLPHEMIQVSAKSGLGCDAILPSIVREIPAPSVDEDAPPKAFLFDCWYDEYRGVVALVKIVAGTFHQGDTILSVQSGRKYQVGEIGVIHPELQSTGQLRSGQVGYFITGMKSTSEAQIGDTLHELSQPVEALPGFRPALPMAYAGLYPVDSSEFPALDKAVQRLCLNDASVSVQREHSDSLGLGFRCGFLGLLHMDVFHQRLEEEFGAEVISTSPTVPHLLAMKDGTELTVSSAAAYPDPNRIAEMFEPMVKALIVTPAEHLGGLIGLMEDRRGHQESIEYMDSDQVLIRYTLPLSETVVTDFFDAVKSVSSGYASFDYTMAGHQPVDLVRMNMLINGKVVDALSLLLPKEKAATVGRDIAKRLKGVLRQQLFEVAIQAECGGKIIARESLKALRKNVLERSGKVVGGGDATRKKKLLEKQKAGKKRMKSVGGVELTQEALLTVMKSR